MRDQQRRAKLRAYFEKEMGGDRARFIAKTRYTKGRLNQLLDANKPFGEKAAKEVARRLGLASDYFESDHAAHAVEVPATLYRVGRRPARQLKFDELELLRLWEPLLDDQKTDLLARLNLEHTKALKIREEVLRRGYASTVPDDALPPQFTRPAQRDLPIETPSAKKANPRPRRK